MNLALGIDTGGTYTDAVLVDHASGQVLAGAKALTTRHDLAIGIREAIAAVFAAGTTAGVALAPAGATNLRSVTCDLERTALTPADVTLVALSTTLATNTLAEGQGGVVCLLLIGYDEGLMRQYGFQRELATDDVVYLRGGHDELGNEVAPLDEEVLRAAILSRRETVEAFAVSGYFAVRNPAHELRARALIEELAGRPVTCGHELTSRLNAVRRATTVALNAHLIAPLRELIASVQQTLAEWGIAAPLMVVKGDGSLVRAEWAMRRPVETILSGPAASVVGAWHLAGQRDVWTVDVGGTTTDIAALRGGLPTLNPEGASVGGWRTMVEAVDVYTIGLGGDSHVRFDDEGRLRIGPRRVVPLCLLATEHPEAMAELRRQAGMLSNKVTVFDRRPEGTAEFVMPGRRPANRLAEQDLAMLARLAAGPQSLSLLTHQTRAGGLRRRRIEELEVQGLVRRAGFTPTDALHALGRFTRWDTEAARLGAAVLAAQAGLPVEAFCEQVVQGVAERVATELVSKVLEDETRQVANGKRGSPPWHGQAGQGAPHVSQIAPPSQFTLGQTLIQRALEGNDGRDLGCTLTLRRPLVAIGAPVAAYMPQVAERLHTELVIPPHAEVANAVGAVAGGIIQRRQALINPLGGDGRVRLHLPDGVHDFEGLEPAVQYAQQVMLPLVEALAHQAGAEQVVAQMARQDQWAPVAGNVGGEIYLGTELSFTAVGRPSPARR